MGSNDPFINAQENEKQSRSSFQELYPIAEYFIKNNIKDLENKDLPPLVQLHLKKIYAESERLVKGSSPADPNQAYVKNMIGSLGTIVISRPWAI